MYTPRFGHDASAAIPTDPTDLTNSNRANGIQPVMNPTRLAPGAAQTDVTTTVRGMTNWGTPKFRYHTLQRPSMLQPIFTAHQGMMHHHLMKPGTHRHIVKTGVTPAGTHLAVQSSSTPVGADAVTVGVVPTPGSTSVVAPASTISALVAAVNAGATQARPATLSGFGSMGMTPAQAKHFLDSRRR